MNKQFYIFLPLTILTVIAITFIFYQNSELDKINKRIKKENFELREENFKLKKIELKYITEGK